MPVPTASRYRLKLRGVPGPRQAEGVDVSALWSRVESALVKTVLAAQALQRLPRRRPGSCVDLFGAFASVRLGFRVM